jgi:hypothetical protein
MCIHWCGKLIFLSHHVFLHINFLCLNNSRFPQDSHFFVIFISFHCYRTVRTFIVFCVLFLVTTCAVKIQDTLTGRLLLTLYIKS